MFAKHNEQVNNLHINVSQALHYKDVVLKKLKKYYQKRRHTTGFKHVRLLRDNAHVHTSAIVTAFLKKEKVIVLHPPPPPPHTHTRIPQTLPHVIFFLFPKLKSFLAGQIPVLTCIWISHASVPYYSAQISVP